MSKKLLVQTIFKRMNIKLVVEVEEVSGNPVMIIGGLTPKWKISSTKGGFFITEVKWVNNSFKGMKPKKFREFRTCISMIVLGEMNWHYKDIVDKIIFGQIKSKTRLVSSRLKK